MKNLIIGLLFCLLIMACNKKPSIDNPYKSYTHNNQAWKSKQVTQHYNELSYKATEVPLQYYLLKNIGDNPQKIDSIYTLNAKERIIEFQFEHVEQKDVLLQEYTQKSYEDAVKYMAFTIQKDFKVVTETNDTIQCAGVHFERNFKVAPYKKVLLYFNNIEPNSNIKLIYNDQLFGNGLIDFPLQETPLQL